MRISDWSSDVCSSDLEKGLSQALSMRKMWNEMCMNPTDLGDVSGYTYTYLMNGTAPAGNWTGIFKPGETIRLRFINGRSEEHTSELQSLMRISYAVFCLKKKKNVILQLKPSLSCN